VSATAVVTRARLDGRAATFATAGTILAALAVLVFWNAFHYDWVRGYDAFSVAQYVTVIEHGHRLPTRADTDVWHNPPFFFLVAAGVQELASRGGWRTDPYKAVQLLSALATVLTCLFAFLTARELWPRSRTAQLGALAVPATTPVLVRSAVLYHPEPLAACLVAAATWVLVRALARGRPALPSAVAAGLLLGLANLTRTWALAALGAAAVTVALAWWWRRERTYLRFGVVTLAVAALLLLPWLGYKAATFGSPLAYSQPNEAQWHDGPRPLAFYTALDLRQVYTHPYSDFMRNRLLPVTYTDWWGDYWRYWDVPTSMVYSPPILPGSLDTERRLQSYVGILPSLLLLAGLGGAAWLGVGRRSPALLFLAASVLLLAVSYVGFLIQYPKHDGDNMKSLYVLDAVMPLAVCGGWALDRLRRLNRLALAVLALIALELVYLDLGFLVLG
jgi:4-amino-4-deoxy-L-arabinose transferase-like glycosyltransferase